MNKSHEVNPKSLFHHRGRLVKVLHILNAHKQDIYNFYDSLLKLQVQSKGINKLKEAFRASVSERRGASLQRGKRAIDAFDKKVNDLAKNVETKIKRNKLEEAHNYLFEELVMLPNIDQKIASMFIKFLVVYLNVWPSLLPFLYVPIDTVVLKIIKRKLKVYNGPWEQSPSVKNPQGKLWVKDNTNSAQYRRFKEFQKELAEIAKNASVPRILVDELWFVGYTFCKEYPLCSRCWIRGVCQNLQQ